MKINSLFHIYAAVLLWAMPAFSAEPLGNEVDPDNLQACISARN